MKYENYEKCKSLVERIRNYTSLLDELESEPLHVRITYPSGSSIMTIGINPSSEHEYRLDDFNLVSLIKEDIATKISNLKKELIDL